MLVLSRKKEESIVIGNQIEVQILKIKGNVVRLGIKAPQHIKILRSEVCPFDVEFEVSQEDFEPNENSNDTNLNSSLPHIVAQTLQMDGGSSEEAVA